MLVLKTYKEMENKQMKSFVPFIIQHNGDGDDKTLERRARFEMNARAAKSKKIEIEVFHVMSSGGPWDIGNLHYVEVPPEGIFDMFECTELTYNVDAKDKLTTSLTLIPSLQEARKVLVVGLDLAESILIPRVLPIPSGITGVIAG